MRGYCSPMAALPVRISLSPEDAKNLRDALRDNRGEWGDPHHDELVQRAARALDTALRSHENEG